MQWSANQLLFSYQHLSYLLHALATLHQFDQLWSKILVSVGGWLSKLKIFIFSCVEIDTKCPI